MEMSCFLSAKSNLTSAKRQRSSFKLFIGAITSILSPYRAWSGTEFLSAYIFNYSCL